MQNTWTDGSTICNFTINSKAKTVLYLVYKIALNQPLSVERNSR